MPTKEIPVLPETATVAASVQTEMVTVQLGDQKAEAAPTATA